MKTWQEIEEEFKDRFRFGIIDSDEMIDILAFFKPYFQEKLHEEAKKELEKNGYDGLSLRNTIKNIDGKDEDTKYYVIREFISNVEKEAYERGKNDTLAEVGRITKTELGTWAKESIGAKAVESVIEALKALKK